jgi:hypothetical protein
MIILPSDPASHRAAMPHCGKGFAPKGVELPTPKAEKQGKNNIIVSEC